MREARARDRRVGPARRVELARRAVEGRRREKKEAVAVKRMNRIREEKRKR